MQILKSTFLYTLLALFVAGGVVALAPTDVFATDHDDQDNSPCYINLVQHPGETEPGERNPHTVTGECDASMYAYYGLVDITDSDSWNVPGSPGEKWIIGPKPRVDTPQDGSYLGRTAYHDYSESLCDGESGSVTRTLEARVNYNGRIDVRTEPLADRDRDTVTVNCGDCSFNGVSISGASSVDLSSDPTKTYSASFNYTGSSIDYQFSITGEKTWGEQTTSGDSASQGIDWRNYGEGTYQVCVNANTCSTDRGSCMTVNVDDPPVQNANLRVESQNPDSGISISGGGNISSGNTTYTVSRSEDLSGTLTAPSSVSGNNFDRWEGCDSTSGRNCTVQVNQGSSQTVRAVYVNSSEASLTVNSSNPNSGVSISGVSGNLSSGNTSYTIERTTDLDGWLQAEDPAPNGNDFDSWSGCDRTGDGGRSCKVSVNTGSSKTVTANYDNAGDFCEENPNHEDCTDDPEPPTSSNEAGLNVRSQGLSNVPINHVTRWQLGDGDSTNYTKYYDDEIDDVWIQAPSERNGMTVAGWSGCDRTADGGRSCFIDQISLGQTRTFTVSYEEGDSGPEPDSEPDPDQAVLDVSSQGVSNVPIDHLREDILGPDGSTSYTRTYDDPVPDGTWWLVAPAERGGLEVTGWNGCDRTADGGRSCKIGAIALGETKNLTVIYEEAPDPEPEINNFSVTDPQLDLESDPPQLHVDDQPFTLSWSTSNAQTVHASGDWSGQKNLSDNESRNEGSIGGTEKTFTYTLKANGPGGNVSDTVRVTLIDPPSFEITAESETTIDGAPGSQATNAVELTSRKYTGNNIEFEVQDSDIPNTLKDEDGVSKIEFDFEPNPMTSDGTTILTIEILQPFYENLSETIRITGTDQSGTAEPEVEYAEFILHIEAFNPRTIEEF